MPQQELIDLLANHGIGSNVPTALTSIGNFPSGDIFGGLASAAAARDKLQAELPPVADLPKPVQDFLESIKDSGDFTKVSLINQFVNDLIKSDDISAEDKKVDFDFAAVLKRGKGDCDDFATIKAGLLRYAGIDPGKINFLATKIQYSSRPDINAGHALCVVEMDNGTFFVLDSNINNIMSLNEILSVNFINQHLVDGTLANVTFSNVYGFINLAPGTNVISCPDFLEIRKSNPPALTTEQINAAWIEHNQNLVTSVSNKYRESLPDLDKTPKDVQDKIKELKESYDKGTMSKIEIVQAVNKYVNDRIQYKLDPNENSIADFVEAANSLNGDCDDYASLKMGMLAHIGFPAGTVTFAGVFQSYLHDGKPISEGEPHAICLIELNDKIYCLDNNMPDITEVKEDPNRPNHFVGQQTITAEDGTQGNIQSVSQLSSFFSADPNEVPSLVTVSSPSQEFINEQNQSNKAAPPATATAPKPLKLGAP
jgi:predicted transglutaminase-like cysteine proteinase